MVDGTTFKDSKGVVGLLKNADTITLAHIAGSFLDAIASIDPRVTIRNVDALREAIVQYSQEAHAKKQEPPMLKWGLKRNMFLYTVIAQCIIMQHMSELIGTRNATNDMEVSSIELIPLPLEVVNYSLAFHSNFKSALSVMLTMTSEDGSGFQVKFPVTYNYNNITGFDSKIPVSQTICLLDRLIIELVCLMDSEPEAFPRYCDNQHGFILSRLYKFMIANRNNADILDINRNPGNRDAVNDVIMTALTGACRTHHHPTGPLLIMDDQCIQPVHYPEDDVASITSVILWYSPLHDNSDYYNMDLFSVNSTIVNAQMIETSSTDIFQVRKRELNIINRKVGVKTIIHDILTTTPEPIKDCMGIEEVSRFTRSVGIANDMLGFQTEVTKGASAFSEPVECPTTLSPVVDCPRSLTPLIDTTYGDEWDADLPSEFKDFTDDDAWDYVKYIVFRAYRQIGTYSHYGYDSVTVYGAAIILFAYCKFTSEWYREALSISGDSDNDMVVQSIIHTVFDTIHEPLGASDIIRAIAADDPVGRIVAGFHEIVDKLIARGFVLEADGRYPEDYVREYERVEIHGAYEELFS